MFEQRIARPRHQHFVAGIAERLEQHGIGLAGAGGEHDALGRSHDGTTGKLGRNRATRRGQTERLGAIFQSAGVRQRGQEIIRVVEARPGRIRQREIDNRLAIPRHPRKGGAQSIRGQISWDAVGEQHVSPGCFGVGAWVLRALGAWCFQVLRCSGTQLPRAFRCSGAVSGARCPDSRHRAPSTGIVLRFRRLVLATGSHPSIVFVVHPVGRYRPSRIRTLSMTSPSRIRSTTSMPDRTCANTVYR